MTVPVYVVVAQWLALASLGLLVIIMYRQLGRVFARKTRPENLGPPLGSRAVEFDYRHLADDSIRSVRYEDAPGTLLAFVDPTCPACEELVENLGEAKATSELDGIRVLLATYEPPDYIHLSDAFSLTQHEIAWPTSDSVRSDYGVEATPLVIAIDARGIVRGVRPTSQLKDIRALKQAALESVADGATDDLMDKVGSTNQLEALVKPRGGI
jgi:hypothetical protein